MARFFCDLCSDDEITISGEDFRHISKSLRMKKGEALTICDGKRTDYECEIKEILRDCAVLTVKDKHPSLGEADVRITIFQCLPKGDKMDGIVQRGVEIGAERFVPVMSERCVSRPDEKAMKSKISRWQKISLESAMQCGRGIVPCVAPLTDFKKAVSESGFDKKLFFYEGGGVPLKEMGIEKGQNIAIFIGPEGGFDDGEVQFAKGEGASICSLGPRILRTQTASLAACAAIMLITDNI